MLPERVLATVRKRKLLPRGTRVLAAVSGGADSVALALVLAELAPRLGIDLAGVAHLNHQLRGADADADARAVEALSASLRVPCLVEYANVEALARESGASIETAARTARYAFFERAAAACGAQAVATGHTADDQAETLLMRLTRGAGLDGLSGVRARNARMIAPAVVRPLIDARRAEVETYLAARGVSWREDASNGDLTIARNRIRHLVMPALKEAAGDAAIAALSRTAALIEDDAAELERQAIEIASRAVLRKDRLQPVLDDCHEVFIDIAPLEAAGPALARRVIRAALQQAGGGSGYSLEHVEAVRSLIRKTPSSRVDVPGLSAERSSARIALRVLGADAAVEAKLEEIVFDVPGAVEVGAGRVLSAELGAMTAHEIAAASATGDAVAVQGVAGRKLTVRSRRPGDALRPLGAPGRRKLQDLFVDRKTSRADRDLVPLVIDEMGRIIWVVGHTIADEFRVTAPGDRVLLLKISQSGTAGSGGFGGRF